MKTILIIEDSTDVRENIAEILKLENYEAVTAENGTIGIEKAKTVMPDLIICDIMMPGISGYDVLKQLNNDTSTGGIPFIFLTAKSERSDVRMGMNLGADDYLTKPFEEKELLEAIECRLKKDDFFKKKISRNIEGIHTFFEDAQKYMDFESLTEKQKVQEFVKKEILYMEGNLAHSLFFIQSGTVKTFKSTELGKEFVTGVYSAGDFIGQLSLLNNSGTYTETAMVLDDTKIYGIPKEDFTKLLFGNQVVSQKFIAMISNNLINVQQQLVSMAFASVRQRAAKTLLDLYEKGIIKDKANSGVGIAREDFAGMIGTATETAIRTLSDFKDEGLITTDQGRRIIILNKEELAHVAEFS
ncbi:response regulator [Sediminicola arcticus]|jgi:DNA-binding response OmpR family regulator|uniref:Response regulator n=1 Tax=Sediminicola arcticus TaxID=1574308 RepID=A0ABV2SS09_9FLAO